MTTVRLAPALEALADAREAEEGASPNASPVLEEARAGAPP